MQWKTVVLGDKKRKKCTVTRGKSGHFLETKLCIFDVPRGAPLHLSPLITTDEGLFAHQELKTKANALGELLPKKGTVPFCPVVGQIGTP